MGLAVVLVGDGGLKAIEVCASTVGGEITEHVIERTVLHHQDHDVVDGCERAGLERGLW